MSIDCEQLTEHIIKPTLIQFGVYSEDAVELLLATAAQESHLGTFLVQQGGPALGIYQMEPHTYQDIVKNVLMSAHRNFLPQLTTVFGFSNFLNRSQKLISDLSFSTIFCRLQYWRYPEPLPEKTNVRALFYYWKTFYNRNPEKGNFSQFEENYLKYVKKET